MRLHQQLLSAFLIICLSSAAITAQVSLKRQKVTKEISMEIPESFTPMTQQELYSKFISDRMPIAMYTSADKRADLGINENSSTWVGKDLKILREFYKSNITNLFTKVEFIQDDIQEIGGRQFVVFEFVSTLVDENSIGDVNTISKYSYIQYTIRDNKVLLFNFSCPAMLKRQWQETASTMMNSVKIKK